MPAESVFSSAHLSGRMQQRKNVGTNVMKCNTGNNIHQHVLILLKITEQHRALCMKNYTRFSLPT
jgi:hypothetical protein